MTVIIQKISKFKINHNIIELFCFIASSLIILLLLVLIYSSFDLLFPDKLIENYRISQILKIIWFTVTIYLGLQFEKKLLNSFQSACLIDRLCDRKDDLVTNAFEMINNPPNGNKVLIDEFLKDAGSQISLLKPSLDFKALKKTIMLLVLIIAMSVTQIIIIGTPALLSFKGFFTNKKPIHQYHQIIDISPGNITIAKSSRISIKILNPIDKAEYKLFMKYEDIWRSEILPEKEKFISNITNNFSYYVANQWSYSDTFYVFVFEDPSIKKISLQYFYPSYLNKRTDYIENSDGVIIVPQFTEIEMIIQTPETVSEANIVFSDKNFIKMDNNGRDTWVVKFKPLESMHYHLSLIDELGSKNQIVNRSITIINDQPPSISFIYPGKDTLMTQNGLFEIRLSASDDYGLRNLKIFTQKNNNSVQDSLIFRQSTLNFLTLSHILDFRSEYLFPGDEIEYWAEIYDNSPLNQRAITPKYKLKYPSIEDIFKKLEQEEQERSNILNNVLHEVREMQRDFDMKRREMLRKEQVNWDDQKALEKFLQDQKAMNEMIENVANNYDKMIKQMEVNDAVSKEILDKMQRIQEIMDQISTEDLKRAMEQMQNSLENINQDELKKAMQDFQFNIQDFAEKLEQTLNLLEQIKHEQNLDRQLEITKEMQKMQDDLHKRTEETNNPSQLAHEQMMIQDKLESLIEQIQKSIDDLENTRLSEILQSLQEMLQDINDSGLAENMQEATEAMEQNQKQKATENQKQSLAQLTKMISKMEDMKNQMEGSGMQEMIQAIQMTIYRTLMISKEHQEKVNRMGNDPIPFAPGFINDYESLQIAIIQLYQAPQILLVLGQKFFFDLNNTIKSYRDLFNDIQNSRFHTHKKLTSDIQSGINLIIYNLMQVLNNMDSEGGSSGSGGGMQSLMQALEQMSGHQMAMNSMTQSLLEQMTGQGNRLSNEMRQHLQEMANEEQRMADNIHRMLHTNPEAQKHANTLNEIAKEMNEVAHRMRQNRIDQNLFDQQNRIMSRLIEVQRSINKRDRSNQRLGETARDNLWELPPELDLNLNNFSDKKLLEDEIQKLPLEYRQIILEYLRRVNE